MPWQCCSRKSGEKIKHFFTNILDSAEQRDKYDTDDSNFHLVEDITTYNSKRSDDLRNKVFGLDQ